MIKKILLTTLFSALTLSACQTPTNTLSQEITGVAKIGLFGGTEMACEFKEGVAGEMKCNTGSGTIYLENGDSKVFLEDYSCSAVQYYVSDGSTVSVEYRASETCDGDLVIGQTYSASGNLSLKVDEQWLKVDSIVLAE